MTTTLGRTRHVARLGRVSGTSLTPREGAVLAAVERRLTNPEIAAELFLSVRTVESHIASLRRKLGAESRGALIAAAGEKRARSVDVPNNPLRGRQSELAELGQLLESRRWITVTGAGGVGKTRLALEHARRSTRTPIVVELEHAAAEDVPARIARGLAIESVAGDPVPAIATALSAHPYLLVLDNIDRVGDAVGAIVSRVRAVARDLQVLTTSRTPFGHPAEGLLALSPLTVTGPDSPAAMLLLDRLGNSAPLGAADRASAQSIAERLDGVPLALELAASVARHLPLRELDARLADGFASLDRAAPAGKHRTLETAFEWTWDLLTEEERDVLRDLAALPGSFDFELATAVTHAGVEGTVLRLLDHSLLVGTEHDPRRFRLLAVLREFVHARTEPARIRAVRERHAIYTAGVALDFSSRARTDDSAAAMRMSAALCPEANAALRWTLAADHALAPMLAAALATGVEQYGADVDSVNALVLAGRNDHVRATANARQLLALGAAIAFVDVGLVGELAELALGRVADDRDRLAALHLAGIAAAYSDRGVDALERLDEAERLAIELGESWDAGAISQMRGITFAGDDMRDAVAALAALESATRRYARAGDRTHVNNCRYMMALIAAENGFALDRAPGWAADAAAYAEATANRHELAHAHLAQAMLGVGSRTPEALVAEFRTTGDLRCVHRSLMLQARDLAPAARIPILEDAVTVAETADDHRRRTIALTALAEAGWRHGDRASAFAALDRIAATEGPDAAFVACPVELRASYRPDVAHN
jgi:predicted ATPase/DNA-binding CsgD family transcriptional regulator